MIRGTVLTDHESLISRCSFLSMLPKPPSNRTIFFSLLKSFHVFVSQSTLDQTGTGQNSAYVARQGATGLTCNLRVGWPRTVGHIQQVISLFMLPPLRRDTCLECQATHLPTVTIPLAIVATTTSIIPCMHYNHNYRLVSTSSLTRQRKNEWYYQIFIINI